MPRFFFDVWNGSELVRDPEGEDMADVADARLAGTAAARELIADAIARGNPLRGWTIEIRGENDGRAGSVPFAEVAQCLLSPCRGE